MGNYSYLRFADDSSSAETDSPMLSSKYHIPIFWFALLAASDMLVRQYPGEQDDHEPWPDLVKNRKAAVELFASRKQFLLANFPQIEEFWLTEFVAFLEASPHNDVWLDCAQTVDDELPGSSWLDELRETLSMFETPLCKPKSILGFSLFSQMPNIGLNSYLGSFGPAFEGYKARQPWAYTGHGIEKLDQLFFNPHGDLFTKGK